jgi:hypothetical protein
MPMSFSRLLGGPALGCLLAGSAFPQDPAPAPETAAAPRNTLPQPAPGEPGVPAESTASSDSSLVVIRFNPMRDIVAQRAADSLGLTPDQRKVFYQSYAEGVAGALRRNPARPQPAIDSVRSLVVVETGRKLRFVRQARVIFADMFSRRARDEARTLGTEEQLWRSPKNVETLIALYRTKPNASDAELEHAMAPSFDR